MRKLPLVVAGASSALLALAAPALAADGGLVPVTPSSPGASRITDTYWFITGFVLFIFVLVEGLLAFFVVRYRRGRRARLADGAQIHGSTRLELMWTAGPVVILAVIAAFVFVKLPGIKNVPSATAAGQRIEITVTGHQFYWSFNYPNGAVSIDRLRVPVGVPVRLTVTAPDWDVIHSWWIPALGGKIDAIPGRNNHTWFEATTPGTYTGRCAELCGVQHAMMLMAVEAMPPAAYEQWASQRVSEQQAGAARDTLGKEEWVGACSTCHGLAGQGGIGPAIATSSTIQSRSSLATVLLNGVTGGKREPMPPVGRDWSDQQIDALAAYVKERFGR